MAVTNPIAPFLWGKGGVAMSPEQVAREREIAALLMQQGDPAFKDAGWLGILGRGLEGGLSGWKERQADEAERAGREGFQSQWDSVFGGGSSPVASALAGGGAASQSAASMANTPPSVTNISGNKQEFVDALLPAAMEASARTGVDPRIIIAQAAQETGWGKSAPGNNYFGIKSHGQGGGQTLNTHEYVNGQRVNVSDSFRTFGSPEDSVAGYADFLLTNPRYRPMMAAQGLDAQLEALGASGYATDPEYANSVGSIARGITIPDGFSGASASPVQASPAQAAQGPDMAALLGLAGNQWANPQQQAVVQALMGQQIQQQDPMYQLQRQKAELELEAMRNPAAPAPVWQGGQWWDISSGMPTALTEAAPSTSFNTITIDVPGVGPQTFNTDDPAQYQMANQLLANGATEVKTPGVSVSVGGNNDIGTIPQGMMVTRDEAGNVTGMVPIPGGPAAIEAEQAVTAAESSAASSAVGAASTATDARAVLDILDNAQTPATGTLSIPFAAYSGSDAGRIRSYVSTLQSGVALGAMQRLKEASATGATGFGALSAPELNLLISEIGALNPDNTEPDIFRATIERINERSKRVARDIMRNVEPSRIQELGLQPFLETVLGDELQKPQSQPNTTSSGVTWSIVD